ncbi:MAG TPA: amidohydrolase [Gammaproteobacteria bacterium]|nr:amidohydrolase [Gammaproteobacteria bacterium]HIM99308.1 amidohydrolase [Gammaproteobacteria bacterium]
MNKLKADLKIISADSHVFEPADLWHDRLDARFKDRAPRFIPNYQGQPGTYFVAEGVKPYRISKIAALAVKPEDLPKFDDASVNDLQMGGWDPAARLRDQEKDGLCAEVIYATYSMILFGMQDTELQEACFRAYNDWLSEFCSHEPTRLIGLAQISIKNVDNAIKEMERCATLGLRGAMITAVPEEGIELSDARFTPLWRTAEELNFPISLHILTGSRTSYRRFDSSVFGTGFYMAIPHELQLTMTDLVVRGVLERHPKLNFVLAEADIGWIPHFLERLDKGYLRYSHLNQIFLEKKPSQYFQSQVYSTFISDRVGVLTRDMAGIDTLMWSSDYPHTDSTWPNSRSVIDQNFQGVPNSDLLKMINGNVSRLYNIKL